MILTHTKKRLITLLIILISGIIIFILGLGDTGLVDETPPLFASAARAMSETGYLAYPDDKKNLLSYVEIIEKIKRKNCREWVEKNASSDIFANKVVNWLNKVINEYK